MPSIYCTARPYLTIATLNEGQIKAKIIIEISRLKWPCASIKFNEELKEGKKTVYETDSIVLCIFIDFLVLLDYITLAVDGAFNEIRIHCEAKSIIYRKYALCVEL